MLRDRLLGLPRRYKRLLQVLADVILVWISLWLAFVVRLGSFDPIEPLGGHAWLFALAPVLAIPLFIRIGMYRAVMRYLGNDALITIAKAVTFSSLLLALAIYWYRDAPALVPRSLVFNYWWISLMLLGGLRLLLRQYVLGDWYAGMLAVPFGRDDGLTRVAIYGAGAAGNQLAAALRMGRAMRPVAFIDDDGDLANRVIAGLKVYKPRYIDQMIGDTGASEVLLAIPSASRARRREILADLERYPLHVRSVPGFMDLASGRVKVEDLQEVDIADLLGRDSIAPDERLLAHCIQGKVVLVTGAGGSIGSELSRQILRLSPTVLLLLDHSEYNLYAIHAELEQQVSERALQLELIPILGSVGNADRLLDVMRTWAVDSVYHAAAYKHVPMVEHNIAEGVMNNVIGTLNCAQAAIQAGVAHFVLISTDKAVRPTNVMGSTKRLAEMALQALSRETAPVLYGQAGVNHVNRTRFTMVRFGNVLGSSGSVIPLFREQIRRGGPVTVTHPKITRYFMTIPEAAQLVLQAGSMGQGGDVFVLDMGSAVRIVELAEKMIHLSGLSVRCESNPAGDIAIQFTGLRPGEKLYEELLIGDNVTPTQHPMIMSANEACLPWGEFCDVLDRLLQGLDRDDFEQVRLVMRATVDGYSPREEIVDWIHRRRGRMPLA
ncbi:NAD-dependent epimerase/dehydratase family protein [Pseudomonas stutzeri]|uniref:polysaccharide biosynthesis protein n=1 Tax=Stutzerimonas stutzeri TaxID=316 RepID=UPI00190B870D|nr:nucleoside-diphosphate sugar epimerase/dehydratase [Stutzerimonas stutzeri]MBK3866187.1 NAD-dependent epimerase/dehydratase family protein [Stutzerimonas stutzeri]